MGEITLDYEATRDYFCDDSAVFSFHPEPTEAILSVEGKAVFKGPVIFEGGVVGLTFDHCNYCGNRLKDDWLKCKFCAAPRGD